MFDCEWNDCGWCYHVDTPFPYACIGTANCDLIATDKDDEDE